MIRKIKYLFIFLLKINILFCDFPYNFEAEKKILNKNIKRINKSIEKIENELKKIKAQPTKDFNYKASWKTVKIWEPIATRIGNYFGDDIKNLTIEIKNKNINWLDTVNKMINTLKLGILEIEIFENDLLEDKKNIENICINKSYFLKNRLIELIYNESEYAKKVIIKDIIIGSFVFLTTTKALFFIIEKMRGMF
jgi:hypothetical protein